VEVVAAAVAVDMVVVEAVAGPAAVVETATEATSTVEQ
jgi:hypothetical protein